MLSVTSAQLDAWLALLAFPLARILGLFAIAPIFASVGSPRTVRVLMGLAVTFALVPGLPPMPAISPGSWSGILIVAQQTLIGVLLGLTLRIAFVAVDVAGEMIGLQMGLSFAVFYDPQTAGQSPVLSEFLSLLTTLLFLAMNGHLLALSVLAESFELLPIGTTPIAAQGLAAVVSWSAVLFSAGVLLALPVVAALLIANIAMGVLSRVAPQLNLFAIGFPVTIVSGFAVLTVSLPYFGSALERLFDQSFVALRGVIHATGAG
jgi:flagellar biosynthesis protein FliR